MWRSKALLSPLVAALAATLFACCAGAARADEPVPSIDFSRDVRPILSRQCWHCHGPDDEARQSGLRLDVREAALAAGDSGAIAIVPGDPEHSELWRRITADESERMPPPDTKRFLSEQEKETLRHWIVAGAEYSSHWAFQAPQPPTVPAIGRAQPAHNEIDHFVLARLEREQLAPAAEASPEALIRRVSLDLIGLPPSPEEIDAFVRDPGPAAYAQLVERLLASPHYGERWARWWLDVARYADTNGYEKDRPRTIWPYRDWVIGALNRDLPFDQFVIKQIAGDMLPSPTPEQIIATGFHRNTMINEEGGIDVEEFRFKSIVDRVQTTATGLLGVTLHCAQCHTHKYDPFTHREYYALFAMLNNADEVDFAVPDAQIEKQRAAALAEIAQLEAQRSAKFADSADRDLESSVAAWIDERSTQAGRWVPLRPTAARSLKNATLSLQPDDSIWVHGDCPNNDTYELKFEVPLDRLTALKLEVLADERLPQGGPGRAPLFSEGDFLLSELVLEAGSRGGVAHEPVGWASASHDYAADRRAAELCFDGLLDTGWSIAGRAGEAHQAVFVPSEPLVATDGLCLKLTLVQQYIHQMTIGRFRIWATADEQPALASELPSDVEAALATPASERTVTHQSCLQEYFLATAPQLAEHNARIAKLRREIPRFVQTMVLTERPSAQARLTHRHHRGEFLDPREPVAPGVPAALHPLLAGAAPNRLGLARWLVARDNPLVGRVTMNRLWAAYFGRGLVGTIEDFGVTGERPSHPELLDWLATEFVARGWSLKAMHRSIVHSATYRQSSRATPELAARDPANVLLARGPRVRLDAELIRDIALAAAGLLDPRLGGPSVYPPQPPGVAELSYGATPWPTSTGGDRFRRGLYTYLKRTSPYPGLLTFDGPTADVTCPRRNRSNTPLQALVLLNDAVFVEAAQGLARRLVAEADASSARLDLAYQLCLGRRPDSAERAVLDRFLALQSARLASGELDAQTLAASEALPLPANADPNELALWTIVARAILNLDETITKE